MNDEDKEVQLLKYVVNLKYPKQAVTAESLYDAGCCALFEQVYRELYYARPPPTDVNLIWIGHTLPLLWPYLQAADPGPGLPES